MYLGEEGVVEPSAKGKGESHHAAFLDHSPTHGYLGYPWSGAKEREGWVSVLAPPSGG